MRKMIALTFTLLLTTTLALAQNAQPEKKKESKPTKAAVAPKAPKSDADVQKCISDKFAGSKTLTGGAVEVSGGAATLSGEAKNSGAKNSAGKTAQACGAKKVTNNITVAAPPAKPPKK